MARLRLLKGILPYLKEIYNRPCFQNFEAIKLEIWRDCDDMNCGLKCWYCVIIKAMYEGIKDIFNTSIDCIKIVNQ